MKLKVKMMSYSKTFSVRNLKFMIKKYQGFLFLKHSKICFTCLLHTLWKCMANDSIFRSKNSYEFWKYLSLEKSNFYRISFEIFAFKNVGEDAAQWTAFEVLFFLLKIHINLREIFPEYTLVPYLYLQIFPKHYSIIF